MLNARGQDEAVGALSEHVRSHTFAEAREMIEAIKSAHPDLTRLFHSDIGIKLQRLDSDMCRDVLDAMILKRRVTTLPVHDSFVVPVSAAAELSEVMERVFERVMAKADIRDMIDISVFYPKTILHMGGFSLPPAPTLPVTVRQTQDSESESTFCSN